METFKEIQGEDCLRGWSVSNYGNVKDPAGELNRKVYDAGKGYLRICLGNPVQRSFAVHRLVAKAFVPNPDGKTFVDHIDGDRRNNKANNLRWVTISENNKNVHRRTFQNHTISQISGTKGEITKVWANMSDCARELGCSPGLISNVLSPACPGYKQAKGWILEKV